MHFKMKTRFLVLAAALFCCLSCIETNSLLGGSFVPAVETYSFHTATIPLEGISVEMADNLSGYSDSRITVGAVRESEYGLTTRSSAVTLIPMIPDYEAFDIGKNPEYIRFHFAAARDTMSFVDDSQAHILQGIRVYELSAALDPEKNYDCNQTVAHEAAMIAQGSPLYNGSDSLSFDFSPAFGEKFLRLTAADLTDIKSYLAKFPGIYLESDLPENDGGRINMFDVQLGYDANYGILTGNVATLYYSAEFDGVRKDTSLLFYYGAPRFFDIDSLLNNYTGTLPQYALNLTGQQTRDRSGEAGGEIWVEGGGGLKPVISALSLKRQVEEVISAAGGNPKETVINKASLVFPFEFPDDYREMERWPYRLSPTCRFVGENTTTFMGLTDSSSSSENQGDVDRSRMVYAPDITYHMQEILKIDETAEDSAAAKNLREGNYDIWLLIMAKETQTTVSSTSQEQQEMLNYLAYSSYYNSMYGGYGGYGGYGYGSGYGSYYSNYLNYAMMAQMASQSQTTVSTTVVLDKDRFYRAVLNGPAAAPSRAPRLELTFALPNEE